MKTAVQSPYEFRMELRSQPDATGTPYHLEALEDDVLDLVEETFVNGVLGGRLPADAKVVGCEVTPAWQSEPLVQEISVELVVESDDREARHAQRFSSGRWARRAPGVVRRLREEGTLGDDESAYCVLFAERNGHPHDLGALSLTAPAIVEETLEDLGVRQLGEGELTPDRPVLCSGRAFEEIIERCVEAGMHETGGAMLGKTIRLPEPLPGTTTPIVTVLSASISDARHAGAASQVAFDPEALVEASTVAGLRGRDEEVVSVYHTHCWGTSCGRCNQSETCPLLECTVVSPRDYELLESLFPCKSSLMPIAGRKLGAPVQRPVMEIHAWRRGALRPIRWQQYRD